MISPALANYPPRRGVPRDDPGAVVLWRCAVLLLLLVRLPSLAQPAGGDQGLYAYEGARVLAGDVPYRDIWDQKPPGIVFVYAGLESIWRHESVVPAADLACAAMVAVLLIAIGRRRFTATTGYGAAVAFLLLGDPYLQRLSGVYVRGQCEPFINVAICAAMLLLAQTEKRRIHFVLAGVALGAAFWLKYNAAAYCLALGIAAWEWTDVGRRDRRMLVRRAGAIALGFAAVTAPVAAYFAVTHTIGDLYLATVAYNLGYSGETYRGPISMVHYLLTFPLERARVEFLWFLGGLGALLLLLRLRTDRTGLVPLAWLAAACASIAINGSRDLPNYFVQAAPPLALAASSGLGTLRRAGPGMRLVVALVLAAGLWRVGADAPVLGMKWAGLPGLLQNASYDLAFARGQVDRDEYLRRFSGKKFNAYEIDSLAGFLRQSTEPGDTVLVFGFSGGSVCWKSGRASATRFFWSMPVIRQFEAGRNGYGSAGLLSDLHQQPPAVVALQKEEWRSKDFFLGEPHLREWLLEGYRFAYETPMFAVWRRAVP